MIATTKLPLILVGAVLALLVLAALSVLLFKQLRRLTRTAAPAAGKRYKRREHLLSQAERQFHEVLKRAVPELLVFPKVRVADAIDAENRFSGDFLSISQKHFDWLLCHPVSFEPLLAVELDDSSHTSTHQQKRDRAKDAAATEAGLPLLRFPWQSTYEPQTVRDRVVPLVNEA